MNKEQILKDIKGFEKSKKQLEDRIIKIATMDTKPTDETFKHIRYNSNELYDLNIVLFYAKKVIGYKEEEGREI